MVPNILKDELQKLLHDSNFIGPLLFAVSGREEKQNVKREQNET